MQAIRRTIGVDGNFTAFDDVKVVSLMDFVVYRELRKDGNARRIPLHIDRSYNDIVGNDSQSLAAKWTSGMSNDMQVDNGGPKLNSQTTKLRSRHTATRIPPSKWAFCSILQSLCHSRVRLRRTPVRPCVQRS